MPTASLPREEDGARLVERCLAGLDDSTRLPPRLFLLWATPSFKPYQRLLAGVHGKLAEHGLGDVPLIGSSVAICLFDEEPHEQGAILICVASPLLMAKTAVGPEAQFRPAEAVARVLHDLGLTNQHVINPRNNRFLITFLPGYLDDADPAHYRAAEIVNELRQQTYGRLHLFGGVSCAGLERGMGSQFLGGRVHTGSVVVALVTADITYGLGLSHGLVETGRVVHAEGVAEHGRIITTFREGRLRDVMGSLKEPLVFSVETAHGEQVIAIARLVGDGVRLQRGIEPRAALKVMRPDSERMRRSVAELEGWVRNSFRVPGARVAGLLGIGCVSRYRAFGEIGFNLKKALHSVKGRYPGVEHAGCYLDGEVGIDHLGRSVLSNWSLSEMFIADDVPARSEMFFGFDALARYTQSATTAPTVQEAMERSIDCILHAGYAGAMISLVLTNGTKKGIVGQAARGKLWPTEVMPRTRREVPGDDILARVAEECKPEVVKDAPNDPRCHQETARRGQVTSFFAFPLLDPHVEASGATGVLQIDLGDVRSLPDLPEEQKTHLSALGAMTAAAVNRAIQAEQLVLVREFDQLLADCLAEKTVEGALSYFVRKAAKLLETDIYVRLLQPDTPLLRLVAGIGRYHDAAQEERRDIDTSDENDPSPVVHVARSGERIIVNDAKADPYTLKTLERLPQGKLHDALASLGAYALFPIGHPGKPPIGIVGFMSDKPWSFSQSRCCSLRDIGQRLYVLVEHVAEKHAKLRSLAQLDFLLKITPTPEKELHVYDALQQQAEVTRQAAQADVASWFLWDDDRKRYVLRAQSGWHDDRWVNAAWYEEGEGVTGTLARRECPQYVPDLYDEETLFGHDKYLEAMFGDPPLEGLTCEVITLPLRFKDRSLGVVTLHRKRSWPVEPEDQSGFATVNPNLLKEASKILSAFVYALQRADFTKWHEKELKRREAVGKVLLQHEDKSLDNVLDEFCQEVINQHHWRRCAVYLAENSGGGLCLRACRDRGEHLDAPRMSVADKTMDPSLWAAYQDGKAQEERKPATLQQDDPSQVRFELLVQRVCLSIKIGEQVGGVLDIHWQDERSIRSGVLPHHSLEDLEELVQRLAQAINAHRLRSDREKSREAAEGARRALTGVAQMLSENFHEIARDVEGIGAVLSRLRRRNPQAEQEELIERGQKRVNELIQLLSRVRQAGSRLANIRRSRCRLDKLLREAWDTLSSMASRNRIELYESIAETEAYVDKVLMLKSFSNLIENAVNAMPGGGVVRLSMGCPNRSDLCEVVIQDDGPGMKPEDAQRHIRGESEKEGGIRTGLGLFLTNLYVQSHNGRVEIQTEPGKGTTIRVFIPLVQVSSEGLESQSTWESPTLSVPNDPYE